MADHPNLDLLPRGYAAYAAGDMDTMNELFADDLVWHVAGRSAIAGHYSGKAQVLGFFGRLQELSEGTSKVEVHDLLANDEHGLAIESATRNDVVIRARRRMSFIFETAKSSSFGTPR